MKNAKVIAGGISIILVLGVVIGVIAGVARSGSSNIEEHVSTTSKYIASICNTTDYKQQCVESIGSVASNNSATPKDYIQAAIGYTISQVQAAMNKPEGLGKEANSSVDKMGLEDCKELLDFAIDELQAAFSMVRDNQLHTLADREAELRDWMSAVISYQQTCLDGVSQSDIKQELNNGLLKATELTSNALAIVSAISDIMSSFNITKNTTTGSATSRKLLEAVGSKGEFPSWVSAADRKLLGSHSRLPPNAVVAKDGSGQYKTIAAALAAYPKNLSGRFVIYVKAGVYDEYVTVTKNQINVYMYGDGPRKTIITGSKSYASGVSTFKTASFAVVGNNFIAKGMGFRNTAGAAGHQAVALRVQSDQSSFYNCRMEGYQDTLYVHAHRQFYRNCIITGTIDFIFGDATAVIQNSQIVVRKPMENQQNLVTAQGRVDRRESTGIVIQNCRIVPDKQLYPTRFKTRSYLGRPWKAYSRTIIMETIIGDFIQADGWMPWSGTLYLDTLDYREYGNRGPGAATDRRVKWKGYKVITDRNEAAQFTPGIFLQGNDWILSTGIPNYLGFTNARDML
ncbi:hypothetical protein L6164_013762 [Bauhinia variegata]|uniref:Uncharacterized protein n=1 Tax=Bauhinia variegata TaxID=167791 RepID=A0ACB9NGG6_BAUVA|nr:hypothetical protein L6164_013762 [Bauhinia variegata]